LATAPEVSTFDAGQLRESLNIVRLRKWSIIVVTLLTVGLSAFYTLRQIPVYESGARVLVKPPQSQSLFSFNLTDMNTEREIAQSEQVAALAAEQVSFDATAAELRGHVAVSVPTNTQILEVRYRDEDPAKAQEGANSAAVAYLQYKTTEARSAIDAIREPLLEEIRTMEAALGRLNRAIAQNFQNIPTPQQQSQRDRLLQRLALTQSELPRLSAIDPGDILQTAPLPTSPASPNTVSNLVLALLGGLGLGIGLAFLREKLDDRLRGRADLEDSIDAPVLAVIPKIPAWKSKDNPYLVTVTEPKSSASEAYRTLRTSMLFSAAQRGVQTILVASASAGEGKTTTASNLAVVLANAEKRVILLEADLRRPRTHRFFKVGGRAGLVNVLADEIKTWDALVDPGIENLRILPSGPIPARPAEILGSELMGELLSDLRGVADFIIIDTAPVLAVSDALALAPLADGILFVADAESTSRGAVAHAREQLDQVGGEILGAVLNGFDPSKARSYQYAYRYEYRHRYSQDGPYGAGYERAHRVGEGDAPRQGRSSI
jgi:succinoglycan biosynthesis transport protein ExoP